MNWKRRGVAAVTVGGLSVLLLSLHAVVAQPSGLRVDTSSAAARASQSADATGVRTLLDRLERVPGDWTAWNALGEAYLRVGTSTADASYYRRADVAFARSLELRPDDNDDAYAGAGAVAAARHDFTGALELARRALGINAYSPAAWGVRVDALVELGRYPEARRALQRMLHLRPSTASLARASYFRELHGDIRGARLALEGALAFASTRPDKLFALQYLGELAFAHGRPRAALRHYEAGLVLSPEDPALLAARAEVRAATGDLAGALADYEASVARLPDPGHLAEYAAVLGHVGRDAEAEEQHTVIGKVFLLADGSADLELAYYAAGVGNGDAAVEAARREYERRVTVQTQDALAYALHVAGRNIEALGYARAAERLSEKNGSFAYHRGLIEAALGLDEARATLQRAVDLNPYSVDGVAAAAALKSL